jgi:virginiamycin B lyase
MKRVPPAVAGLIAVVALALPAGAGAALTPTITESALPASSQPIGVAVGSDGALWTTQMAGGSVARTTTAGAMTSYALPTPSSQPRAIAAGSDGKLWVAEYTGNRIARIDPLDPTGIVEYPLPTASASPTGIVSGPDGNLWFTETAAGKV